MSCLFAQLCEAMGIEHMHLLLYTAVRWLSSSFFFLSRYFLDFVYLFLKRGEGREKERERNINVWLPLVPPLLGTWPETQACALTGNLTSNPLVRRPALNPLSHANQAFPILSSKEKIDFSIMLFF